MSICVGDIIELEPDSSLNKLAKVIEVKKGKVEAIDLSTSRIVILPIEYLYEKQDVTGNRLKPSEEKELSLLGAKNLWVKINPEQYKKQNLTKLELESSIAREKELEELQIKFLSDLFKSSKNEESETPTKEINIFDSKEEEKIFESKSPLSKFIKKKD